MYKLFIYHNNYVKTSLILHQDPRDEQDTNTTNAISFK